MWKNLRSDLTEFVSTVTNDTTDALNRMDENFPDTERDLLNTSNADASTKTDDSSNYNNNSNNQSSVEEDDDDEDDDDLAAEIEECERRMKLKETFTTPLLPEKKTKNTSTAASTPITEKEGGATGSDGDGKEEEKEKAADDSKDDSKEDEAATDEDGGDDDGEDEEAVDDDEEEEVRAFLESFSLEAKKDEIASSLEAYPDTLKVWFEELVPKEVTHEEFWQRYFYRCDPERVAAEWAADEERAAANRNQAVKMGLTAVSNFLGGAVQAVSASLAEDDAGENDPNAVPITRRPPFVMSADSGDEDEEEVELGWDDDDDEEEDDDDGDEQNQIEFQDAAVEKLQEQLKTAIEERDLLHQTVEMQTKEIAALKEAATAGSTPGDDTASSKETTVGKNSSGSNSNDEELEKLKTQLFEKDAELAALRASILDTSGTAAAEASENDALEQEIKRLSVQLNESETRAKDATSLLSKAKEEVDKSVSQTKQVEGQLAKVNAEKSSLEASLESHKSEAQTLKSDLQQSQERAAQLEKELHEAQEQLSKQRQEEEQAAVTTEGEESVDSPATQDSAVKVEAPAVQEATSTDDGEGWDDDW